MMEQDGNVSEISFKSDHRHRHKLSFTEKLLKSCLPDTNSEEIQTSFPFKYFNCCLRQQEKEIEISDYDEYDGNTYMINEEVDGVMSLFPSKYLRRDERLFLKFDKENIISFIDKLSNNDMFIRKFEKFNKFGLRMFMLDKNEFSATIPVTRCQIEIPNQLFVGGPPSVEQIGDAIINPERRIMWDDNYKEYKILKKINSNTETIKIVTKKQFQMIIPREFFDKRTHFMDNGIFYCYSSSAPDSIRPPKKEPIRVIDFFCVFTISGDTEKIFIDSFHQIDIKIGQPGPLIFMSLPLKMTQFTENLLKYFNQ